MEDNKKSLGSISASDFESILAKIIIDLTLDDDIAIVVDSFKFFRKVGGIESISLSCQARLDKYKYNNGW